MTRSLGLPVVLFSLLVGSFVGCGGGDEEVPVGDNLADGGGPPPGSPGSVPSSGGFGGSSSSSSSSNGANGVACGRDQDCPEGDLCIERVCQGESSNSSSSSGGGSGNNGSGGTSSSSGNNPGGKGLAEPCTSDAQCASNLCTSTRQTGVRLCSKQCTRGQDNWDFNDPDNATNCPEELPLCGDEVDAQGNNRPTTICRHDV